MGCSPSRHLAHPGPQLAQIRPTGPTASLLPTAPGRLTEASLPAQSVHCFTQLHRVNHEWVGMCAHCRQLFLGQGVDELQRLAQLKHFDFLGVGQHTGLQPQFFWGPLHSTAQHSTAP
jgi:hypothetical protein